MTFFKIRRKLPKWSISAVQASVAAYVLIGTPAGASACIDTNPVGNGWGWDGATSCQVTSQISDNNTTSAEDCIDTDPVGDGWGWDGAASCRVSTENNTDTAQPIKCVDTEPVGDGWGWDGAASCRVPSRSNTVTVQSSECVDTVPIGDGWGWNGKNSCEINTAFIINGTDAGHDDNPFQVQVSVVTSGGVGFCGGSLIRPDYVVTAAHCFFHSETQQRIGFTSNTSVVGGTLLRNQGGQRRGVKRIALHPSYSHGDSFDSDVAVLELTDSIQGVSLATLARDDGPVGISDLVVTGWGLIRRGPNNDDSMSIHLQKANAELLPQSECATRFPNNSTENIICARADTCNGDSGGPLARGRTLIGITSFGPENCPEPLTGFTRVSSYSIRSFIEKEAEFALTEAEALLRVTYPTGTLFTGHDFDKDGRDEAILWANGYWHYYLSSDNYSSQGSINWGLPGDTPFVQEVSGDGNLDLIVFRDHGTDIHAPKWYVNTDFPNGFGETSKTHIIQWGLPGDIPSVRDYNQDNAKDLTVRRPSTNRVYYRPLASGCGPNSVPHFHGCEVR